jgi:DNA-binding Lrp family transcriptional regulator
VRLTDSEKKLCNLLQDGLPICRKPFEKIARQLKTDPDKVLKQINSLKQKGVIRKISPIINYQSLGKVTALVAAHIEGDKLKDVVRTINGLAGVSHNYLRCHFYNLWFTLRGETITQIKIILNRLSRRFDIKFHSLPAVRQFKLDVRFDAASAGEKLLPSAEPPSKIKRTKLTGKENQILKSLQAGLKVAECPFDFLCSDGLKIEDVLAVIKNLIKRGVIRRIAAAVDYEKLGFKANSLFACRVEKGRIERIGRLLAALPYVSHCYSRKPFEGFNYNLFAMCHLKDYAILETRLMDFAKKYKIKDYLMLKTIKKVKPPDAD